MTVVELIEKMLDQGQLNRVTLMQLSNLLEWTRELGGIQVGPYADLHARLMTRLQTARPW